MVITVVLACLVNEYLVFSLYLLTCCSGLSSRSLGVASPFGFNCDSKTSPWTDGKGLQDDYAKNVIDWGRFHDIFPIMNLNKLEKSLRGSFLKS